MLKYRYDLKPLLRILRNNMTDAEEKLWFHIRRKQILATQFYRQRPIGKYIADFYAPVPKLVIELDGSQHLNEAGITADSARTAHLESTGIHVLRFTNTDVLTNLGGVLEMIHQSVSHRTSTEAQT